jgi:hypothetical protein
MVADKSFFFPSGVANLLTPFYRINKHGAVRPPAEGG